MENRPSELTYNENLEHINEPGDVITETLMIIKDDGRSYDISNFCSELVLFEDVFSNVMMGHAKIVDAANFITQVPLVGSESITISYRTPTFSERIAKTFKIIAINDRRFTSSDKEQGYTISFISTEGYLDNSQNLGKKFTGTTDEVIKNIFFDYLASARFAAKEESEKTQLITSGQSHGSTVSFVACSWSPLKCINWVASRSFGNSSAAPSFLFFESNKGFRLLSIEELIDGQKTEGRIFAEYVYTPNAFVTINDPKSKYQYVKPELVKQYGIVRQIAPFTPFDLLESQDNSYHAGTLITQDYTLKKYNEFPFDYTQVYNQFKHLDDPAHHQFPDGIIRNPEVKNVVRTKAYKLHNDMKDPIYEKWMLQRNSLIYEATKFHIEVEVAGRTDIEVGNLVNFLFPKGVEKTDIRQDEDALDPYISGLYLITSIRHSFSLNKHTMYLELMKDSFKNPV